MIRTIVFSAPLLLLTACASSAPDAGQAQTTASAKCVGAEAPTGTMLKRRGDCPAAFSEDDKRRMAAEAQHMVRPTGVTAPGK